MTAYDDIMRELREFNRFTGDNKPGEPVNAPLPVGDPRSGVYNPKKAALRLALGNLALELVTSVANVITARDEAIEEIQSYLPSNYEALRDQTLAARDATLVARDATLAARDQAVPAAAAALADANRAEMARDASFLNANLYATVADGRNAVANGQQFSVVDANGVEIVRYRRDSPTTQTEMARYPTALNVSYRRDDAVLMGTASAVSVNSSAKTITISGRVISGRRSRLLSGVTFDYSSLTNEVHYIAVDLATGTLTSAPAGGLSAMAPNFAPFMQLASVNTGELVGLPGGFTLDGIPRGTDGVQNGSFIAPTSSVTIDHTAKTLTLAVGGRVVGANRTIGLNTPIVLDYSALSGSRLLVYSERAGGLTLTIDSTALRSGDIVLGRLDTTTGLLSGIPNGFVHSGRSLSVEHAFRGRIGAFFAAPSFVNVDLTASTVTFGAGRIIAPNGINVLLSGSQVVSFSAQAGSSTPRYLVFNIGSNTITNSLNPPNTLDEILIAQLIPSTGEIRGIPGGYQIGGSDLSARLNIGIALAAPGRLNFDFTNRKVEVLGNIQVAYNGFRILVTPQVVDYSTVTVDQWVLLLVNPSTAALSIVPAGSAYSKGLVVIGGCKTDEQLVQGIDNYMVNGRVRGSSGSGPLTTPFLAWDITETLTAPAMPSYAPGSAKPLSTITSADIIGWYDALVAANPGYITKTNLGNAQDGSPVYEYRFKPPVARSEGGDVDSVRAMVQGGIHNEPLSFVYPYHLMKMICENWASSPVLEALRWGVEFSVIPALCPYVINNNSRTNSRGVNINRNYPAGWAAGAAGDNYPGTAALSEAETQLSYAQMQAFKPHVFIDCHTFSSAAANSDFIWVPSASPQVRMGVKALLSRLSRKWKGENANAPDAAGLGYVTVGSAGGSAGFTAYENIGAMGFTFETNDYFGQEAGGAVRGSPLVVRYAVEAIGNLLLTLLRRL